MCHPWETGLNSECSVCIGVGLDRTTSTQTDEHRVRHSCVRWTLVAQSLTGCGLLVTDPAVFGAAADLLLP